jgi:hypothetical protein
VSFTKPDQGSGKLKEVHVCQFSYVRFIYDMVIWESSCRLSFVLKKKFIYVDAHRKQARVPFCFWSWLLLSIQDCIDYMIEDLVL